MFDERCKSPERRCLKKRIRTPEMESTKKMRSNDTKEMKKSEGKQGKKEPRNAEVNQACCK
jgi:hypothetical protein